ncbi:MAG: hypothetical protein JXA90_06305 [Planctomycetes bacterium]|nr:hypothetical protein [Planctomycetota bacterium]
MQWFVLHTKSRQEKILAADLAMRGVDHYLPLVRRMRYYGRKKVEVDLPLFPGYLFLRGTHDQAYDADRTERVARIIQVVDQSRLEWEIESVRKALSRGAPLGPDAYMQEGVRVEVRSGPWRGLQGYVKRIKKNCDRLVLQVDAFGKAVSLEIDGSLVEPLN